MAKPAILRRRCLAVLAALLVTGSSAPTLTASVDRLRPAEGMISAVSAPLSILKATSVPQP